MVTIISFYPGAGGNRYYRYTKNKSWTEHDISYDQTVSNQYADNRYFIDDKKYVYNNDCILTHCVNTTRLKKLFPDSYIIVIKSSLKQTLLRKLKLDGISEYLNKVQDNIDRIEHYRQYKDPGWPDVLSVKDLEKLPKHILNEVNENLKTIKSTKTLEINSPIDLLKQKYNILIDSYYETIKWHIEYYKKYPTDLLFADLIVDINSDNCEFSKFMKKEIDFYYDELYNQIWDIVNE